MDMLTAHAEFAVLIDEWREDLTDHWPVEDMTPEDWELKGPALLTAAAEIAVGLNACHDVADLADAVQHFVSIDNAGLVPEGELDRGAAQVVAEVMRWGDAVGNLN